jgi:hypothetical protein
MKRGSRPARRDFRIDPALAYHVSYPLLTHALRINVSIPARVRVGASVTLRKGRQY